MGLDQKIANEPIIIDGETYTFADLTGVGVDLTQEFKIQSSRYAYISALAAKAEALYSERKGDREALYADLELEYREKLADSKPTEGKIKSNVITDDEYLKAVMAENDALRDWKLLRALVDGLRQRGEMLISLGAHLRAERDFTDMHINETKERLREMRG